jgi:hypothetical protein
MLLFSLEMASESGTPESGCMFSGMVLSKEEWNMGNLY